MIKRLINYFSKEEIIIWTTSVIFIIAAFGIFDRSSYLTLVASLIGVTSLIFNAKGNPFGQFLMVIFSLLYGLISFGLAYYGEMITYIGMTMPMAIFALISWMKHPFDGNKSEVEVNSLKGKEYGFMMILAIVVTIIFYFILEYFNTACIGISTLSVTTSFIAVYLTYRRSPNYALGYGANDVVLILLWVIASMDNLKYVSVVVCFMAFIVNDIYGYINWKRIKRRQDNQIVVK